MNIMKPTITSFLTAALVIGTSVTQAQYDCADYQKFNCERSTDSRFSLNGQSRSASVKVGEETELNIIVYRGQDYRISVCHDEKILGEQLAIRLVEKTRVPHDVEEMVTTTEPVLDENGKPTGTTQEVRTKSTKKVYDEVEKVLWDNTASDMVQEIEFSCTATKRIAVEVNAPGPAEDTKKKRDDGTDIGCVGILIEHMPTPGLGF
ncbi:MAG: hypothetical protein ABI432_19860 [Flavobacteriales bacterium]